MGECICGCWHLKAWRHCVKRVKKVTLFALGNTNEGAGKPWDRRERGRCWQLSCSIFQSWLLKQICKFRKLNRWRRYMNIFMHSRGRDCFMQSLSWKVIKLYVICKFTGPCWRQFCILSTHCSWAQIALFLRSKAGYYTGCLYIDVSRVAWEAAKLGDKSLWLSGLEPCPGLQVLFGVNAVFQSTCTTLGDLTLHYCNAAFFLLLFFFIFLPKVGVLSGTMTSLLQSHPLYPRQLIVSLVLKHPFSHQNTSLHLHLPGLLIRTGHIHPLIPDSPFLLQTWQAFLLHILQIPILSKEVSDLVIIITLKMQIKTSR